MKILKILSKEARRKIIKILYERRSRGELAKKLRVGEYTVYSHLLGRSSPSDFTIEKALEIANEEERERIYEVIVSEVIDALREFINEADVKNEKIRKLKECLSNI